MKFESLRIPRREDNYQRWLAYSQNLRKDPALVAYYTFESAGATNAILPNLSAAGSALDGRVDGGEWVYGRLPGKFALLFHGPGSGDKVALPQPNRFEFTGPFSVAVWFKVDRATAIWPALVAKGDTSWRLQYHGAATAALSFDTTDPVFRPHTMASYQIMAGRTKIADGRWHLAVAVYEPAGNVARKRLYLDGGLDAEGESSMPRGRNDLPVWLGANAERPERELQGLMDEVAIFSRYPSRGNRGHARGRQSES